MKLGHKIIVLGCSGSGKSTFSKKLHDITGLPLLHLDNIWWMPDRSHISREEFDRKLGEILQMEKWIIDGDYSRTYEANPDNKRAIHVYEKSGFREYKRTDENVYMENLR